jgi:acyl carrier protein
VFGVAMPTISSRTPEGVPNRCPICAAVVRIEPSQAPGDAPCPACGHLLWFSPIPSGVMCYDYALVAAVKERVLDIICESLGINRESVTNSSSFSDDLRVDSLDVVELVMELEELNIKTSDEDDERIKFQSDETDHLELQNIKTVGDLIDYLFRIGRGQ